MTRRVDSEAAAREALSDVNRFFLASLYDVQIDVLQLYLAIQNDADVVEFRRSRLREKIKRYREDFGRVLEDDRVAAYHRELKRDGGRSGWRRIPESLRAPIRRATAGTDVGGLAGRLRRIRPAVAESLRGGRGAEGRKVRAVRRDFDGGGRIHDGMGQVGDHARPPAALSATFAPRWRTTPRARIRTWFAAMRPALRRVREDRASASPPPSAPRARSPR